MAEQNHPDWTIDNEVRKKSLVEFIKTGDAILMAGSGCSCQSGFPSWTQLLDQLVLLCKGFDPNYSLTETEDPGALKTAQNIVDFLSSQQKGIERYRSKIRSIFNDATKHPIRLHEILMSLPLKAATTTNYDSTLSKVGFGLQVGHFTIKGGSTNSLVRDFFKDLRTPGSIPDIAHIHGHHSRPDEIILTERDYFTAYGGRIDTNGNGLRNKVWTLHRQFLWPLFALQRFFFVGFSFDDPYLSYMLSEVVEDLWGWDDAEPQHFAIMAMPSEPEKIEIALSEAIRWREHYCIETVFYNNASGDYRGLTVLLEDISREVNITSSGGSLARAQANVAAIMESNED